jgi:hypothetical protein
MTWAVVGVAVLLASAVLVLPSRADDPAQDGGDVFLGGTSLGGSAGLGSDTGPCGAAGLDSAAGRSGASLGGGAGPAAATSERAGDRGEPPDWPHGPVAAGAACSPSSTSRPEEAGPRDVDEIASAMALLALAYRTGLPTWQVLTVVAQTSADPVASDLRQVATALQWGASEAEAWASVGPAWAAAARVVSLAHAGGVPPGPLLTSAADDLHRAELDRLEVAAAQVGVRLVAPLGLVLLPAFCLTSVVPLVVALGGQLLTG